VDYIQKRQQFDLTGEWRITNHVESAKLKNFEGLRLEFRIFIDQSGSQVTGRGEKVAVNGRELPAGSRTGIVIHTGTVAARHVRATFEEFGEKRRTIGTFEWTIEPGGRIMNGRFTSLASDSHGSSKAEKVASAK
jgi:hypothetical protein